MQLIEAREYAQLSAALRLMLPLMLRLMLPLILPMLPMLPMLQSIYETKARLAFVHSESARSIDDEAAATFAAAARQAYAAAFVAAQSVSSTQPIAESEH
jgi:hypothetical protein